MNNLKNYILRKQSVVTGKRNLKHLYTIKNFPVFFGCVESSQDKDLMCKLEWVIEKETGVIQLLKLIPLDILYQAQHVDGCGPTWQKYYNDLASYVIKNNPRSVLEIGGGAGQLAQISTKLSSNLTWTIVEPNPWVKETERIKTISAFFDDKFKYDKKVDTVVFSQVLEHAYNPHEFIEAISKFLKPGGRLIFAYPQLELWLSRKYTNSLNTEHTMFLTDYFVDYILACHNFHILDKYKYNDHSHFYVAEKFEKPIIIPKLKTKYNKYKKIFMDFIDYHKKIITQLNKKIKNAKDPVYLFGAHIFSSYLFAFGLKDNKICGLLDNSQNKQGKRLYGTRFIVESPKILKDKGRVNVILRAGIYNKEIKKDILDNINSEVVFW